MTAWTERRNGVYLWFRSLLRDPDRFDFHGCEVVLPSWVSNDTKYNVMRRRYEREEAQMADKHLSIGDSVIELGGSLGLVSALVRSRIGPEPLHVVVEANAALVEVLARNAGAGDRTHVVTGVVAPDDGTGTAPFYTHDSTLLGTACPEQSSATGVAVPRVTIGGLVERYGLGEFALVCDIEGGELDVLREFEAHDGFRCTKIIAELHPDTLRQRGVPVDEFLSILSRLGFDHVERADDTHVWLRGRLPN